MNNPRAPDTRRIGPRPLPDFKAAVPLLVAMGGRARTQTRDYAIGQLIRFTQVPQQRAKLSLRLDPGEARREDLVLAAVLYAFEDGERRRDAVITANGREVVRFALPAGDPRPRFVRCLLPEPGPLLVLELAAADAAAPGQTSEEPPPLGWGFQLVSIDPVTETIDHMPDDAVPALVARERARSGDADGASVLDRAPDGTDAAGASRVPHRFDMPWPDVGEDSVALLLLVDLPADAPASSLVFAVDGRDFACRVEPRARPTVALRIGPIGTPPANRTVSVRGPEGADIRAARLVGWREGLPHHFDRPDLIEVLAAPADAATPAPGGDAPSIHPDDDDSRVEGGPSER